jgi:hypothetical protein
MGFLLLHGIRYLMPSFLPGEPGMFPAVIRTAGKSFYFE